MKLIFSRKGFDSSVGGVPSPLVDDRPISLPIPTRMPTPTQYADLSTGVAELVTVLTRGRIAADRPCHLDPDLDANSIARLPGWRGPWGRSRFPANDLNETANLVVGKSVQLLSPADIHAETVQYFSGCRQRRIV